VDLISRTPARFIADFTLEQLRAVDWLPGVRMREYEVLIGLVAPGLGQQLELAGDVVTQGNAAR